MGKMTLWDWVYAVFIIGAIIVGLTCVHGCSWWNAETPLQVGDSARFSRQVAK